ncbi:sortase [Streptomyces thinghirensis]|nr:sortase [Streptomyces thinghirensis]
MAVPLPRRRRAGADRVPLGHDGAVGRCPPGPGGEPDRRSTTPRPTPSARRSPRSPARPPRRPRPPRASRRRTCHGRSRYACASRRFSVDAPFTDLAIGANGQLQAPPPDDTNLVGWYAKGASPGEEGTSIIAGHVDTKTSAAALARLGQLEEGRRLPRRESRRTQRPPSWSTAWRPSTRTTSPASACTATGTGAEVRLITCAGDYDRKAKDYTDNLVVFAHSPGVPHAPSGAPGHPRSAHGRAPAGRAQDRGTPASYHRADVQFRPAKEMCAG